MAWGAPYEQAPPPLDNNISYHCPLTFCYLQSLTFAPETVLSQIVFFFFYFSAWNSLPSLIFAQVMFAHQLILSTNTMSSDWSPLTTPILFPITLLYFLFSNNLPLKLSFWSVHFLITRLCTRTWAPREKSACLAFTIVTILSTFTWQALNKYSLNEWISQSVRKSNSSACQSRPLATRPYLCL